MSETTAAATFPRPAWAHKDKKVDLHPIGAIPFTSDQLLDRAMIAEVFYRWGIAHDEGRVDVLATCFTEDGVIEVARGSAEPFVVMDGRKKILEEFGTVIARQGDQRRHCITNIVIEELGPSDALALGYGVVPVAADGLVLGNTVIYRAELRKEADGFWRFTRFFIGTDSAPGRTLHPS